MAPKGAKRAESVAVVVLYGIFLTRMVVGDRGPRLASEARSTPSCSVVGGG